MIHPPPTTMDYWYGRDAQRRRDGEEEFVVTPLEWFQLCELLGKSVDTKPSLLMGRPIRVSWETVIRCPHCGHLPNDGGTR